MEILVIGIIILIVSDSCILWQLLKAKEDIRFLRYKVELLEHRLEEKSDPEPEQQTVIDYENLKQEL